MPNQMTVADIAVKRITANEGRRSFNHKIAYCSEWHALASTSVAHRVAEHAIQDHTSSFRLVIPIDFRASVLSDEEFTVYHARTGQQDCKRSV